jgi:hypothetical protein
MQKKPQEVPTLPPPPLWRLIVAAVAIAGFLYFLYAYQTAVEERAAPPSSQNSQKASENLYLRLAGKDFLNRDDGTSAKPSRWVLFPIDVNSAIG